MGKVARDEGRSVVTRQASPAWAGPSPEEERLRPLYSRVLGLRHVNPGGLLCFFFFEGAVCFAVLLGLAELVSWWAVLLLPASVAAMVKVNDEVAAAVARSAARVPQAERERFRREMQPAVGRAAVPESSVTVAFAAPAPPIRVPVPPRPVRRRPGWFTLVRDARRLPLALPRSVRERCLTLEGPIDDDGPPEPGPTQQPRGVQRTEPPATGRPRRPKGCSLNAHPLEQFEQQQPWQWPPGLDPPTSAPQRARQSGRRRYG